MYVILTALISGGSAWRHVIHKITSRTCWHHVTMSIEIVAAYKGLIIRVGKGVFILFSASVVLVSVWAGHGLLDKEVLCFRFLKYVVLNCLGDNRLLNGFNDMTVCSTVELFLSLCLFFPWVWEETIRDDEHINKAQWPPFPILNF